MYKKVILAYSRFGYFQNDLFGYHFDIIYAKFSQHYLYIM